MSLDSLFSSLAKSDENINTEITEERIREVLPQLREQISFFREYPDIFIDFLKEEDSTFNFFFYQRIFLRVVMRHRYVYATFPRASKNY